MENLLRKKKKAIPPLLVLSVVVSSKDPAFQKCKIEVPARVELRVIFVERNFYNNGVSYTRARLCAINCKYYAENWLAGKRLYAVVFV